MQEKAQKTKLRDTTPQANEYNADRLGLKQVYNKPRMVSYGPLAKNIAIGIGGGTEANSTFFI